MSKGEATRQRIVARAAPIFNQRGFGASAMSDVMRATGLQKGGIYRHFDSKEDLALEAFEYTLKLAFDAHAANLDAIPNTVDRLKQFLANFVGARVVPGGCPIFNAAVDADDGNPKLRARALRALDEWTARLIALVREGQRRGEITRRLDARDVTTVVISALEGALIMGRLGRSGQPLRRVQRHLNAFLERQVRRTPRRTAGGGRARFDSHNKERQQ